MKKVSSYISIALMLAGVVTFLISLFNDSHDPLLYTTYFCMIASVTLAVVASVAGLIIHPKTIKTTLAGVGAIAVLAIVSYMLANDEVLESYGDITPTVSKLSDMGLYMMYILMGAAIASIVFSGVKKMLS